MGESNGDFWASVEEMQRNPSLNPRRSQQRYEYDAGEHGLQGSTSQVLHNNNVPMTMNEEQNRRILWNEIFPSKERDVDQRLLNMASGVEDNSFLKRQQQMQNYRGQGNEGFQNYVMHQGLSADHFPNPDMSRFSFKNIPSMNEEIPAHNRAMHYEEASSFMKNAANTQPNSIQAVPPTAVSNSLVNELKTLLVSNVEVRNAVLELYQKSDVGNLKSAENTDQIKKVDNESRASSSVKETGSSLYERRNSDFTHENAKTRDKSVESKRYKPRSRGSSPVRSRRRSRSRSPIRRRDYRRMSRDRSRSSDNSSHIRHSKERDRKDLKRKNDDKLSADLEAKISKIIDEKSQKMEHRTENVVPSVDFGYNTQFSQLPPPQYSVPPLNRNVTVIPRQDLNQPMVSPHGNFPPPHMWQMNYQQQQGEPRLIEEALWNYRLPPPPMPPAPRPSIIPFPNEGWDYDPKPLNRASKVLVNVPLDGKSNAKKGYYVPKTCVSKVSEPTSELPKVMKRALEQGKDSRSASKSESKKSQTESKADAKKSQGVSKAETKKSQAESRSDSKKPQAESKKAEVKKSQVESKTSSNKSGKSETAAKQTTNWWPTVTKPPAKVKSSVQSTIQLNLINKPNGKNEIKKKFGSDNQVSPSRVRTMKKKIRKKFNVASCMYCGVNHIGRIESLAYEIVKKNSEAASTKTEPVCPSGSPNVNANTEEDSAVSNNKDVDIIVTTVVDRNALKKNVEIVNISDEELEDHCATEEKTEIKATETAIKPTETAAKPTETAAKPTETAAKPTETAVNSTETAIKPIQTAIKPTETAFKPTESEKLEDISSNDENEEKASDFDFLGGSEDEFILLEEFKETEIEEISSEEEDCVDENLDVENFESSVINDEDFDIKEPDKVTVSIISGVLAQTISPVKEVMDKASLELIEAVDKPNICESRLENIISDDDEMIFDTKSSVTKETEDKLHELLDQITDREVVNSGHQENETSDKDQMKENENDDNSNECEILEQEKEAIEEDVSMEQTEDVQNVKVIDQEKLLAADVEEKREERDFIPIVTLSDEKCEDEAKGAAEKSKQPAFDEVIEIGETGDEKADSTSESQVNENSSEVVELEGDGTENTGYYLSEDVMKVLGSNIVDLVNDIEDKLLAEKNISEGEKIEVIEVEDTEECGRTKEPIDSTNSSTAEDILSPIKELRENGNESQIEREESISICEAQSESSSQVSKIALTVNSDVALDHFIAGSCEKAMQLLHQQVGIINFVPYKSIIEKCVIATIEMTPEMPSYSEKMTFKLSFNMEDMVKRLQTCYQATTAGVLEKALLLFRLLLRDTLLMKIETKKGVAKARMLMKICRNYITCFTLEMKKKELNKADVESEKRACELAAYATHCNLQPVHQILTLRIANSLFFKMGNFKTAAVFAKKILDAKPNAEIAEKTRKMLAICEKTLADNVPLDYHSERSFVICAGSLTPTYSLEEEIKCPLCQASYIPCFKGSLCNICNLAEVGKVCSGLKLVND